MLPLAERLTPKVGQKWTCRAAEHQGFICERLWSCTKRLPRFPSHLSSVTRQMSESHLATTSVASDASDKASMSTIEASSSPQLLLLLRAPAADHAALFLALCCMSRKKIMHRNRNEVSPFPVLCHWPRSYGSYGQSKVHSGPVRASACDLASDATGDMRANCV